MLSALKRSKRRVVQKVLESQGKADPTLHDAEFELAVRRFLELEKQYTYIYHKLKEARKVSERFAATHAALSAYLSLPFAEDASFGATSSSTHDSVQLAHCMARLNEPVQRACSFVVQSRGVDVLSGLIESQFPERKRQIAEHEGKRVDVESYRRRVKALQDKGAQGNDAILLKFTTKLENAQAEYNARHAELLCDLNRFYAERFAQLEPVYAAYVAAQAEFFRYPHSKLGGFADSNRSAGALIEAARLELQQHIAAGGPPPIEIKPKTRFFSRIQSQSRNSLGSSAGADGAMYPEPSPGGGGGGSVGATSPGGSSIGGSSAGGASPASGAGRPALPSLGGLGSARSLPDEDVLAQHTDEDESPTAGSLRSPGFSEPSPGAERSAASLAAAHKSLSQASMGSSFSAPNSPPQPPFAQNQAQAQQQQQQPQPQHRLSSSSPLGLGTGTGKRNSNGGSLSALLHSPASQGSALGSAGEDNIPVAVAAQAKSATSPLSPSTSPVLSSPGLSSPAFSGDVGLDEWVVAAFPFKGTDEDDLSFKAGDRIRVVEKNDPGWWKGELNGKQGLMPVTYLRLA